MDIQFNPQDKDFNAPSYEPTRKSSKMVGWVVKLSGGTISESQANYVLIGLAGVFFVVTIVVVVNMVGVRKPAPTYREDLPESVKATLTPEELQGFPSRNK